MFLERGTPIIANDCDCPEGKMVAVIMYHNEEGFKARYLASWKNLQVYCWGKGEGGHGLLGAPTPLADFGAKIEWLDDDTYRVVQSGKSKAQYRDGVARGWQEQHPKYYTARKMAKKLLGDRTS